MPVGHIAFLGAARFQGYWDAYANSASGSGINSTPAGAIAALFSTGESVNGGYHLSTNLTASNGDYWQVTGSGTHNVDGQASWDLNDWVIYSGSAWHKLAFEDTITSIVFGDLSTTSFHMGEANNQHLIFASGSVFSGSTNLNYNYDTDILTVPQVNFGGNLKLNDDVKLIFGNNDDAHIEYNENGDDYLTISGSAQGIVLSGSTVQIDGTLEGASPLKIGGEVQFTSAGEDAAFNFGPNKEAKIFYKDGASGTLIISGSSANGATVSGSALVIRTTSGIGVGVDSADITHAITLPNNRDPTGAVKANSFISYSSKEYKKNISPLMNPMQIVEKLNGVSFEWKDSGRRDYGFIAEDVGEVLPGIVAWGRDKKSAQGIEYQKIISFLVEALKQQNQDIKSLHKSFNQKLLFLTSFVTLVMLLFLL